MGELDKIARLGPLDFVFQDPDGKERVVRVIEVICTPAFGVDRYPHIHDKATAILYFLILDHLMLEGNKRFAMAVTEVFLGKNGYSWNLTTAEYIDVAVRIADRQTRPSVESLQEWMADKIQPRFRET